MIEPGSEGRVLFLALGLIAILLLTLAIVRAPKASDDAPPAPASRAHRMVGGLLVVLGCAPLLWVAPWAHPGVAFGDAVTHARVAAEIAQGGLPHGWIASYLGGFPFGVHYPPLAWLGVAALIRASIPPLVAIHVVGWLGLVAAPLSFYVAVVRCGARPATALVGACMVSWIAPSTAFVGGYEAFLRIGVISQVCALPLVVLGASCVARATSAWPATLWACAAVLTHPQLAIVALVAQLAGALAAQDRDATERALRASLAAAGVAIAAYGPGMVSLGVPFGWPADLGWRQLGFEPRHVVAWLRDGELLDVRRTIVITDLTLLALFAVGLQLRAKAARAVAAATLVTLAIALGGHILDAIAVLRGALAVLQPLRALALVPPLAALAVVAALELARPHLAPLLATRPALAPHATTA
ncbi:MAG: hypothetical protein K1X94_32345, partial [Sandaracinaceae bacterium]|nr:hypothetical protein [Sandaracinaceae bacterium]